MQARKDPSMYWDVNKTLSHNCLFNFIVSQRGGGKTYGALKFAVSSFLRKQDEGKLFQFAYVRRQENELKKLTISRGGRLFDSVAREFPDHALKAEGNTLTCDGKVCGFGIQLSTAFTQKSDAFPFVDLIIFDEFIAAKRGMYLNDEITQFLELYQTIARPGTDHNDVKVLFLGNAVSRMNPYFDYFRLDTPYAGEFAKFGKTKDILVQNVDLPELQERQHQSRFGQLISGTDYADYSIDNKWFLDDTEFLSKKSKDSKLRSIIRIENTWLGIWYDELDYLYYVSPDVDMQCPIKFAATTDDHKPNMLLIKSAKSMASFKHLMNAYNEGAIRYESLRMRVLFREVMRLLNCR